MSHEERNHALLSASSAHRWLACTPSARLEEQFPDTTSEAAKEGTLAHELAELKVRNYFKPHDVSKRKLTFAIKKMKENPLWDDEMLEHTDTYIDYIRDVSIKLPSDPYVEVEKQVRFDSYVPEGFGTADCIMIQGETLFVVDFKYGKGVLVSAEENPQMMLYALGAYDACKLFYPIKQIRLAIVQPRLPDGISEWGCSLEQLLEFGDYVKEKAAVAFKGDGEFVPGEKQCRFCRAKSQCGARAEENVKLAFATDKKPPLITNEEVRRCCKMAQRSAGVCIVGMPCRKEDSWMESGRGSRIQRLDRYGCGIRKTFKEWGYRRADVVGKEATDFGAGRKAYRGERFSGRSRRVCGEEARETDTCKRVR